MKTEGGSSLSVWCKPNSSRKKHAQARETAHYERGEGGQPQHRSAGRSSVEVHGQRLRTEILLELGRVHLSRADSLK